MARTVRRRRYVMSFCFVVSRNNLISNINGNASLLAIAFCWAYKTGEWHHEVKPIKIKTHRRPAISLFRYGLDYIDDILMNLFYKRSLFSGCLVQITPTQLEYM